VQLSGPDYSFSLVRDDRPLTEHVHLAFPAREDATVRAFHAAALAAGYENHGAPGERAVYHPGYYGAFVLDPDGHNVEGCQPQPGLSARQIAGRQSGRSAPAGELPDTGPRESPPLQPMRPCCQGHRRRRRGCRNDRFLGGSPASAR